MAELERNSSHPAMYFHGSQGPRPLKKIDFMTGSERMLKAHHKNTVFTKCLEQKKLTYDQNCNKNLGKIQQEMYEVYFKEFLPLKEQASQIRTKFPDIEGASRPKLVKQATFHGRGDAIILPKIASSSLTSLRREKTDVCRVSTEDILARLRNQQLERERTCQGASTTEDCLLTSSGIWRDNISVTDELPYIDEKRLQILRTAISLTSQPALTPEPRKPRRLRKSFLVSLRRQSKVVWENDLLGRINLQSKKEKTSNNKRDSVSEPSPKAKACDEPESPVLTDLNWRPSLSKNCILNADDDDDDDDDDDIEFKFVDRINDSVTSLQSRWSSLRGAPVHEEEDDLYHSDTSPSIFSVISERTDTASTDWSSSTDSDYSFYSSDSEFDR